MQPDQRSVKLSEAMSKHGHLLGSMVCTTAIQGCTSGELVSILPNMYGIGDVVYVVHFREKGIITRLIDPVIREIPQESKIMSDPILQQLADESGQTITTDDKTYEPKTNAVKDEVKKAQKTQAKAWEGGQPKGRVNKCVCGCGSLTASRFAPGHDSKVKSLLKRAMTDDEALSLINDATWELVRTDPKWSNWYGGLLNKLEEKQDSE